MASRKLLLRAARLIEEDARLTRESCQGADREPWVCGSCEKDKHGKCDAQRDYDKRAATAKQLRAEA